MTNNKNNQIEDIFADTDKGKKPVSKEARPALARKRMRSELASLPPQPAQAPTPIKKSRIPLLVLIVFVVLVVIGLGIVLWRGNIFSNQKNTNSISEEAVTNTTSTITNTTNTPSVELPPVNTAVVDTDGDGLSDEIENELGTKINLKDTDNDQLFDREEVVVYKTNPLKSDTDGDGVIDGVEVANGYDPNGPGKLLDLQAEIEKL